MGSRLGTSLGLELESMPCLARAGRSEWSRGLGTLGPAPTVGAAAATSTVVGTRSQGDMENY